MKLKMNKACDLNSISVLPPHSRRTSMIMAQQPRSQASQQSFSQGVSSQQNVMFSQLSQNSFDEILTDNQKFSSQDKDNSLKRVSCLPPISYPREESQAPMSMSSGNLPRRWNSVSLPDQKCQLSGELEHKFATMDTLLSRLGMILDSVQADIMQVNKGTKELSLAVEGVRQKSITQDDSLHILKRGQEEIKTSIDTGFKSISNQLSNNTQQEKMQEQMSTVLTLLEQIEATVRQKTVEISNCFSEDLQTIIDSLKTLNQKHLPLAILPPKITAGDSSLQKPPLLLPKVTGGDYSSQKPYSIRKPEPAKISSNQGNHGPKIEQGGWTTVKPEQGNLSNRHGKSCRNLRQRRFSPLVRQQNVVNLDEESDEDFSCFIIENEQDNRQVDEETERILRKARRRKRKQSCKR